MLSNPLQAMEQENEEYDEYEEENFDLDPDSEEHVTGGSST